jgi:hypothetical protein
MEKSSKNLSQQQMTSLCKFRHVFGEERKGVHSFRLLDIAIVDVALTLLVSWMTSSFYKIPFGIVLCGFLLLGMLLHWMFCVDTTINRALASMFVHKQS